MVSKLNNFLENPKIILQTMSCKLLLNLVDCIRQRSDSETTTARDLLIIMLKVFTKKFHTIAKLQLPLIMQKW